MELYTQTGELRTLQGEDVGAGAEGRLYELADDPDHIAKIFHEASTASAREAKLLAMIELANEAADRGVDVYAHTAWPRALLYNAAGDFMGFEMDRNYAQYELDDLYAYPPKPDTDFSLADKIEILIGLCKVVQSLHALGQVIGDLNPDNIRVECGRGGDWSICLLDTDSFHITAAGKNYRCTVCAPGYVAPELVKSIKGTTYADFAGETFTRATDLFSLSVHIFRMLMNGVHPYTCQSTQNCSESTPKSIDQRVELGESPFFVKVSDCIPPLFAPDIGSLPPYIQKLFRRAFLQDPKARPTENEWITALRRMKGKLVACDARPYHLYWKKAGRCPYCEAQKRFRCGAASEQEAAPVEQVNATAGASVHVNLSMLTSSKVLFWTLTLLASALTTGALAWKFSTFYLMADSAILSKIFFVLCCASSVGGSCFYNYCWCLGEEWNFPELALSLLVGICTGVLAAIILKLITIVVVFVVGLILVVLCIALAFALVAAIFGLPLWLLSRLFR